MVLGGSSRWRFGAKKTTTRHRVHVVAKTFKIVGETNMDAVEREQCALLF